MVSVSTLPGVARMPQVPRKQVRCRLCGIGHVTVVDGAAMRAIRECYGLKPAEVSRRLGISAAYLSDMELGRRGMSEEWAVRILELCQGGSK
jgi:predicted transcriptional regulator